ncbi:MAG: hypothetical protein U0Q21_04255 [Dermatophilaceae bacterium]
MASLNSKVKAGAVGVVAAVAAGIGISQAMAASPAPSPSSSSSGGAASANSGQAGPGMGGPGGSAYGMGGRMGHHGDRGMGGGFMLGRGADLSALATALGVDQAKLTAALQKVGQSLHDQYEGQEHQGTAPTEAERTARLDAFATALAKELGIDKAKVTAALTAAQADRRATEKAALTARLDAAVKAGKLTEADKAAVLKAFDAGVLGGPGRD